MTGEQQEVLVRDTDGLPLPPWRVYWWWPTSMGWRMGGGDEYLWEFRSWFASLGEAPQREYRSRHRPPLYWWYFYRNFGEGGLGCALGVAFHLLTLPATIPAYWWRRLVGRSPEWDRNEGD
jgi:hypothetical protein